MKKLIKFSFITTLPVFFGYIFLGIAFGLLLQHAGYGPLWALSISTFIFAGSMQFVLISFLGSGISLISVLLMTLSINSRHMFYGLTFIEKFKHMGKLYPYMIFSLTDETYSLLCGTKVPSGLNEKHVFFLIASMNHLYWITGSVLGAVLGEMIRLNTTGIDFAMTALFVVIFVEQWLSDQTHIPAFVGMSCGIVSLLIFGTGNFLLPALIASIGLLFLLKKPIESNPELKEEQSYDL